MLKIISVGESVLNYSLLFLLTCLLLVQESVIICFKLIISRYQRLKECCNPVHHNTPKKADLNI